MECYCDYDPPEFYHLELRKARKEHRCSECANPIHAGEKYEHVRAKWDDEPAVFNTCLRCLDLREYVEVHVPCFCWYHGSVIENAIDEAQHWAREAPGLIFGAYRRQIAIRRNK